MADSDADAGLPRLPLRPGAPGLRPPVHPAPRRLPERLGLHLSLLGLTVVTTTFAGYILAQRPGLTEGGALMQGLGFSATLLTILLAHEMGHYVFARLHHVDTTLPFVIPVPPVLPVLGDGLVRHRRGGDPCMRSPIATRAALIDIGAAGPIVGVVVALPLLGAGPLLVTRRGEPHRAPELLVRPPDVDLVGGGPWPPAGLARARRGRGRARSLARGQSHHARDDAADVRAAPARTRTSWSTRWRWRPGSACSVTSLNLFPLGQLDGGHVAYAVLGERGHGLLGRAVSYLLLGLACASSLSWLLWWALTRFVIGFAHPPVQRDSEPLGGMRAAVVALSLALFLATFIPVPLDSW